MGRIPHLVISDDRENPVGTPQGGTEAPERRHPFQGAQIISRHDDEVRTEGANKVGKFFLEDILAGGVKIRQMYDPYRIGAVPNLGGSKPGAGNLDPAPLNEVPVNQAGQDENRETREEGLERTGRKSNDRINPVNQGENSNKKTPGGESAHRQGDQQLVSQPGDAKIEPEDLNR